MERMKPRREPIFSQSYNEANSGEVEYKDFLIRREPNYQLWQIVTKDGQHISGTGLGICLHGMYTSVEIAKAKIEEYLMKRKDEESTKNSTASN